MNTRTTDAVGRHLPELLSDRTLAPTLVDIEVHLAAWVRKWRLFILAAVVLLGALLISPLVFFFLWPIDKAKIWADVVEKCAAAFGVLAGAAAVFKWVFERRERATTTLLELEQRFQEDDVRKGRIQVDYAAFTGARKPESDLNHETDALLRFYVLMYDVYVSRQVAPQSLSNCFGYWLAHYYRKDRPKFRAYVNTCYPTLGAWLKEDWLSRESLFRPRMYFEPNDVATEAELWPA